MLSAPRSSSLTIDMLITLICNSSLCNRRKLKSIEHVIFTTTVLSFAVCYTVCLTPLCLSLSLSLSLSVSLSLSLSLSRAPCLSVPPSVFSYLSLTRSLSFSPPLARFFNLLFHPYRARQTCFTPLIRSAHPLLFVAKVQ